MTPETLKLYHSLPPPPNSRRVRIFPRRKRTLDSRSRKSIWGKGEQHSQAYRAINPRRSGAYPVLEGRHRHRRSAGHHALSR